MGYTPTVLELAEEYFPNRLEQKSPNTYQITGPHYDSVVIFDATNTYCRFSNKMVGGPTEFLRYIVGLSESEVTELIGVKVKRPFEAVRRQKTQKLNKNDTGLSLLEVVSDVGYNDYIASRNVSKDTATTFKLEVDMENVVIPLHDIDGRRIGSQVRHAHVRLKGDRYRTYMAGSNEKPCAWPLKSIRNLKRNSVVVLVEGVWSVMRIHQVIKPLYPNIVPIATMGTTLTEELYGYLYSHEIIAIIDKDEGGKKVIMQLQKWRDNKAYIECYDIKLKNSSVYVDDIKDTELIKLFNNIERLTKTSLCKKNNTKLVNRFGGIIQ